MSKTTLDVQKNLGTTSGTSKAGKDWEQVRILCKTQGEYPKDLVILVTGKQDVENAKKLKGGETITTTLQPESREYNGKWYTDVKIWGIEVSGSKTQYVENPQDNDNLPF